MRALRFDGKNLKETRIPRPRQRRREALIRVHLAGICSTDLEIMRGYMAFKGIPGHEFVGTVVSAPKRSLAGRRVVGEINAACGRCSICKRGLAKHCPNRTTLGIDGRSGAFAEYLTLPVENLHTVPSKIGDEEAAMTEPLAAACEITERVPIARGSTAAVLGDGRLASLVAQVLALRTDNVEVFGINPKKLAVIRGLGVRTHDISCSTPKGRRFDLVAECTGSPKGLPQAIGMVRPQGTVVLKSTFHGSPRWNPTPVAVDEITIVGSRCGPFDTALRLLGMGSVDVRPLITAVYPFERWKEAFLRARRRDSFKVMIRIGE